MIPRVPFLIVVALTAAVLIVGVASCGGGASIDPETTLTALLEEKAGTVLTIDKVTCVDVGDAEWDCVVESTFEGTAATIGGTLRCDDTNCVWRPG